MEYWTSMRSVVNDVVESSGMLEGMETKASYASFAPIL